MDWDQNWVHQDVLAGRFTAWSPCLRGLEDMTVDLFDPHRHLPTPKRTNAFKYQVHLWGLREARDAPLARVKAREQRRSSTLDPL